MVGDAVADVTAARDAGVPIASVVWDSYGKEKVMQTRPDFLFYSVGELRLWLEQSLLR